MTPLMAQTLDAFSAAALHAGSRHHCLDILDHHVQRHDVASLHNQIVAFPIVSAALGSEVRQAKIAVFHSVYVCKPCDVVVANHRRLAQNDAHFGSAPIFSFCALQERSKHIGLTSSIHFDVTKDSFSQGHDNHSQFVIPYGYQTVSRLPS